MLISIIVPIFNVADYLARCLDSIIAQTHKNIEIILINDGSTDDTAIICNQYAKVDSRIVVVHQENAGVSEARNVGLALIKGDWIGFVDADDWVEPEMFETLLDTATSSSVSIAACGFVKHFSNGWIEFREYKDIPDVIPATDALQYVLCSNYFEGFLWNKLFNAKLIKSTNVQFSAGLHTCQDLVFVVEVIMHGGSIAYTSKPLYHYCLRMGSKTQSFNEKRLTELTSRLMVVEYAATISEKCAQVAKSSYTAAAAGLIRSAVACGAFEYLPDLKAEARRYISQYIVSKKFDFRLKVRTIALVLFPKFSFRIWILLKKKYDITWWYKELKKG